MKKGTSTVRTENGEFYPEQDKANECGKTSEGIPFGIQHGGSPCPHLPEPPLNPWLLYVPRSQLGTMSESRSYSTCQLARDWTAANSTVDWRDDSVFRLIQAIHSTTYAPNNKKINWFTVASIVNENEWKWTAVDCENIWQQIQAIPSNRTGPFLRVKIP